MQNFEVYTQEIFERNAIKIYFILREGNDSYLGKIGKNGNVGFKKIDSEEAVEDTPTLIMDYHYFKMFGKAIFKELEKHNIKPEEESFIKGKLEATKYHLEDLRGMLKLK